MYVINERTCSTSGLPVANCGCDGHRQNVSNFDNDKLPAGGSLANNSALFGPRYFLPESRDPRQRQHSSASWNGNERQTPCWR